MPAQAFDAVRAGQLRSVGTAFLRLRPWVVGPALPCVLTAAVLGGAPAAQIALLGAVLVPMLGFFAYEAWRGRSTELSERWLFRSLVLTIAAIVIACSLSGGIRSPLFSILFAPVVTVFAAFGRGRESQSVFAEALVSAALLAALPSGWPFPPFPPGPAAVISFGALTVALVLLRRSVAGLTDAHFRAGLELDRMRQEALSASADRMKSLEALSGKLAHELKNPLASIKALVQLLERSPHDERSKQRVEVVVSELFRMESILEEYLSFSRPLGELSRSEVDLSELAEQAVRLHEARAGQSGIELTLSGTSLVARVDARKLRDALSNLLTNAIEASERGGSVQVVVSDGEHGPAIEVHDSGKGIPPEALERVGTPFFTTRPGGTGLGIVIARGIVEQHGGQLEIESESARGTRVRLVLPATCRSTARSGAV